MNNYEILLAQIPHIKFIVLEYPEGGAEGAAKLFMVMNGNDVTVNIKGGATHNRK